MTPGIRAANIDALCHRHCAFVLYRLPGDSARFCMAEDGKTLPQPNGSGFIISTFEGETRFIPEERTEAPQAENYPPLSCGTDSETATTREEYGRNFRRFSALLQGEKPLLQKIVLARTADVTAPGVSPCRSFVQACELFANTLTVLLHTPELGTWLFSTPELLVEGWDSSWSTMALAGTRPLSSAPWDGKNTREQGIVADFIREVLHHHADTLEESPTESLSNGRIEHLCTRFRFRMEAQKLPALLQELPPTPAVCGFPPEQARAMLRDTPDIRRSCYAGYFGPVSRSSARLYVALRGMRIFPDFCRLYAGGGIMPDSDEEAEWLETEQKMQNARNTIRCRTDN
ncbi:MAG: chorismate-binding protein [Akkermansia sp.]|nr:chorismate-binding protein [Akkermansia sp.]